MSRRRTLLLTALALFVAIAAVGMFYMVVSGETPTVHYAAFAEAVQNGAVSRGWMPPNLPKSACDITEWHDLDSNHGGFRFQYDRNESAEFLSSLEHIQDNEYLYKDPTTGVTFFLVVDSSTGRVEATHPGPNRMLAR